MFRSNLAAFLTTRYEQAGDGEALEEAIVLHRQAVDATSRNDSEYPKRLANLAVPLLLRAERGREIDLLDEADQISAQALAAFAPHDAGLARSLNVAARAAERRHHVSGDEASARRALQLYRRAAHATSAPAGTRVEAAHRAARLAARLRDDKIAAAAFRDAVALLERVVSPAISTRDQERILSGLPGLPSDAAALAIANNRPQQAIELLERDRALLLGRALESRADSALREREPQLAARLRVVQQRLDRATRADADPPTDETRPAPGAERSDSDERADLARQYDLLVDEVRALPGFADFRQPPSFARLAASVQGPIAVINISEYRCDALIVTGTEVRVLALEQVSADEITRQSEAFLEATDNPDSDEVDRILAWIWENIGEPVLRELGITGPAPGQDAPRVWWCPTGLATVLPLHAAGHHHPDSPGGRRSVLDWTTTSYTPTLRALAHQHRPVGVSALPRKLLIIGVAEVPGQPPLVGVERDIAALTELFPDASVLTGDQAHHTAVLRELGLHPWVHLACHGKQGTSSPFDGRLLDDGPLLARQIAAEDLPDAELAFASACETFRASTNLPDEAITLASVLHLAGYRHVVATQWQINEMFTDYTARAFYQECVQGEGASRSLHPERSAYALRSALLRARDSSQSRYTSLAVYWAPYIHTGP